MRSDFVCLIHISPEIWMDIPGLSGEYQVSNKGRLKRLPRTVSVWSNRWGCYYEYQSPEKILNGSVWKDGYERVELTAGVCRKVEHWVLLAFVGPKPKGLLCRHFPDRNKLHNCLENISWATYTENNRDKITHGTITCGEKICTAKLTKDDVILIRKLHYEGRLDVTETAKKYGVIPNTIYNIITRQTWKHLP